DDAEVTLTLMPVTGGDAGATLARLETELKAETTPLPGAPVAEAPGKTGTAADAAKASAEAQADAARAGPKAAEDQADAPGTGDAKVEWDDRTIEAKVNAKLREKGIDVEDGGSGGDSAHVDMPGIHINARGDKADVHVGPIHIDANGETATVKSFKDVRMRGEAFSRTKRGVRAMFLYAGDDLGNGYKYVGYEAAGPRTGPLAVAVVRSKTSGGFHGDVYGDVKRLVRRNGGT
ncbi:MAG TPA: hypothetical protein VFW47_14855, partial [Phenylobacterium sp.]|nr:hypothetical protein [Phenylobacterium sp.]